MTEGPELRGSIGSRISWGAILGGAFLALGLYLLFLLLGSAVGLSLSRRMTAAHMETAAIAWSLLTLCASLFVGGIVTSHFTIGENKVEGMVYGILMWSVLACSLLILGAIGVRSGFSALAEVAHHNSAASWESLAREAGVPANEIEKWQTKLASGQATANTTPMSAEEIQRAATRVTWYTFAGMWISMMAAAAGGWLGAGSRFQDTAVTRYPAQPAVPMTR